MKVTFKLQPRETGLRSIGAAPRGYKISLDGRDVGTINPLGGGARAEQRGWYYVIFSDKGFAYRNTCRELDVPLEDVKRSAKAYVIEQADQSDSVVQK